MTNPPPSPGSSDPTQAIPPTPYPPAGGYGPPPGGAVVALAAVVVVALVATGVGVFLVTRDGGEGAAGPTRSSTAATSVGGGPGSVGGGPGSTAARSPTLPPPSTGAGPGSTTEPDGTLPDGTLPGGDVLDPIPEDFPTPEGARPSPIGLEVPAAVEDVAAFYEQALAGAGYTVAADPASLDSTRTLAVEGDGVTGRLVITDLATPTTTMVAWVAG